MLAEVLPLPGSPGRRAGGEGQDTELAQELFLLLTGKESDAAVKCPLKNSHWLNWLIRMTDAKNSRSVNKTRLHAVWFRNAFRETLYSLAFLCADGGGGGKIGRFGP